jgi:uncharacterized phage infection (PIP) family protein YhgE
MSQPMGNQKEFD